MLFADALDFRPIGAGRYDHATSPLHGFTEKGSYLVCTDLQNFLFQQLCLLQAEFLGSKVCAQFKGIGLINMRYSRNRHDHLLVHGRHATQTCSAQCAAVVGILAADDQLSIRLIHEIPVSPDHADHGVDRF